MVYVDDIFCVLRSKDHLHSYLTDLNNRHPSIKFTVEEETNGMLPFLDILTNMTEDLKFTTTTYIKPTKMRATTKIKTATKPLRTIDLLLVVSWHAFL